DQRPTEVSGRLVDLNLDAVAGQLPGGDQSCDAAADDDRAHADPPARRVAAEISCTCATVSVSTAGSVLGGTPCPRLKMWPGAWAPRSSTVRMPALRASAELNNSAG